MTNYELLNKMRELSGAEPEPKNEDYL